MRRYRVLGGVLFIAAVAGVLAYLHGAGLFPSFEMIRSERMMIEAYLMENLAFGVSVFVLLYVGAVALSVPIATPLTLLSGFLFGPLLGTIVVVCAATTGATLVFILARFFFRDYFSPKIGERFVRVNRELADHGFKDILLLRLAPVVPFALINAAAALTRVSLRDYVAATFLGIVPFTFVYVLAGVELGEIHSLGDVISFKTLLVISLVALSAFVPAFVRKHKFGRATSE